MKSYCVILPYKIKKKFDSFLVMKTLTVNRIQAEMYMVYHKL